MMPSFPLRIALAALALLIFAAPAGAASSRFTIRGAGYGHGVGMSQYGAFGMALQGWEHPRILRHYYTGTSLGSADPGRTVRVLLQSARRAWLTAASEAGDRPLDPAKRYGVRRAGPNQLDLLSPTGRKLARVTAPLRVTGSAPVVLLGRSGHGRVDGAYRGALEFHPDPNGGVYAVNAVGLEDYLRGVVPIESPPTWPQEALRAQAIAARTYAITTSKGGAGYDQFADTRSQVYGGVGVEQASTDEAVRATRGRVVTLGGAPVVTYFFSTSGGRTEDVENVFIGAQPQAHLKSVEDPYDDASPRHRWGPIRMSLKRAGARLRGLVKGGFRGIQVVQRGSSPRVVYADVIGSRGRTRVTGATLRSRFGLYDTWAYFTTLTADERPPVEGDEPDGRAARVSRGRALAAIAGYALGLRRGARVSVEQRVGRAWVRVGGARVGRAGRYRVRVYDAGLYRVVARGVSDVKVKVRGR